jgi:F-type H+-transporting ATPase subunit epsilon
MAGTFKLSVVAPDRSLVEDIEVQAVIAPAIDGYIGFFSNHSPFVASLKSGLLRYTNVEGERNYVSVAGGFVEFADNICTVLANRAQQLKELTAAEAERLLAEAKAALSGEMVGMSKEQALEQLEVAMNVLKAHKSPPKL